MKKLFLSMLLIAGSLQAQTKWNFDNTHTKVEFTAIHLGITEVTGQFKTWSGTVVSNNADFSDAQITFEIDVNSINTDLEMRDTHLKSDDFFNAEKYPKMKFKSKSFKKVSGNKYKLIGDLTIRDVTKTVEFDVVYGGTINDPWGNTKAGFKLMGKINRQDYNLKWNTLTEATSVVSNDIEIVVKVELTKEKK
jgi:polyisoprenoid-binding protein YceI